MWMEQYNYNGKYIGIRKFMKDSLMFSKINEMPNLQNVNFTKLSEEEYKVIKSAFIKFPLITKQHNLNVDTLKNYLGWYEKIKHQ